MNFDLTIYFSFSVAIAAVISWVRFKRIAPAFYPFLFLVWLGLANEIVSAIIVYNGSGNAINNNIFSILESLLMLWFFKRQRVFDDQPKLFYIIGAVYLLAWTTEMCIFSMNTFNSYFIIFYSFITTLCSIHMINRVLLAGSGRLLTNPVFILGLAFIIYFTNSVLLEIFWLYGLNESKEFRVELYHILVYINLGINLVYALAVLWMPARQRFTLL